MEKNDDITEAAKVPPNGKRSCFTIMPFGGWFDSYYESIYVPGIEAAGLSPRRADDLYRPSTIVSDIWAFTQEATVVLADLSGKNPNVFYELGLAHALAKPAVLVAESMDDVPFDLRALRVIEYDKNESHWGVLLQEKISKALKEVLESPIQSVLPAFLSVDAKAKPQEVTDIDLKILELKREIDLLRSEVTRGSIRPGAEARSSLSTSLGALSPREREIAELVLHGHTNKEIAQLLGVSIKTVEVYIARLLETLNAATRTQLVLALRRGGL